MVTPLWLSHGTKLITWNIIFVITDRMQHLWMWSYSLNLHWCTLAVKFVNWCPNDITLLITLWLQNPFLSDLLKFLAWTLDIDVLVKMWYFMWIFFLYLLLQGFDLNDIYLSMNWDGIGSGYGLSPVQHQAITWTNAALLSVGHLGTNFSEIWIVILSFSVKKIHLKMFPGSQPSCLSLNVLIKIPESWIHDIALNKRMNNTDCIWTHKRQVLYLSLADWLWGTSILVAHIPQCTNTTPHDAPFCNKNVHMCAHLLQNGALWDICLMHCGICEM